MSKYSKAVNHLDSLISNGVEFPEAEFQTIEKFNIKDREKLVQMYDMKCDFEYELAREKEQARQAWGQDYVDEYFG